MTATPKSEHEFLENLFLGWGPNERMPGTADDVRSYYAYYWNHKDDEPGYTYAEWFQVIRTGYIMPDVEDVG